MRARLLSLAALLLVAANAQAEERQIQVDVTMITVSNQTLEKHRTLLGWSNSADAKQNLLCTAAADESASRWLKLASAESSTKMVAAPKLITRSEHASRFLTGGQVSVPTAAPSKPGEEPKQVYRSVGTEFECTPTISDNGNVRLDAQIRIRSANRERGIATSFGFVPGFDEQSIRVGAELTKSQSLVVVFPSTANQESEAAPKTVAIIKLHVFDDPPQVVQPASAIEVCPITPSWTTCRVRRTLLRR